MKRTLLIQAFIVCISGACLAQGISISIDEAIELALENRNDLKSRYIDKAIADNDIIMADKSWLPEVTLNGSVRYNTQLQQNVFPEGFLGSTSQENISLGTKNNTNFSLNLEQDLINPDLKYEKLIARQRLSLEEEKLGEKINSIKLEVAEAYLNAMLKQIQLQNASEVKERFSEYYSMVLAKDSINETTGTILLLAKIDYQNAIHDESAARQNYEKALSELGFKLNLKKGTTIELADDIDVIGQKIEQTYDADVAGRTEIKQLEVEKGINELELEKKKKTFVPKVAFVANYTQQFQSESFNYFEDFWSPYNYLGVQASLPVSNLFTYKDERQGYQLKDKQYKLEIMHQAELIQEEINSSGIDLEAAALTMANAKETHELSKEIFELVKEEFALGTLLYDEVIEKDKTLLNAQANYMDSVYSYLVAKLNYNVARGIY